ncbi:MAG: hypothetical protein WBM13_09930 [Bacteroidia bacterium]
MKTTANGRYCDICRKEVFDFTNKTIAEVNKLDKEVCGVFLPEHVEDGLTPIKLNFVSKTKYCVATIATLIGLESQILKAQNQNGQKNKTEFVIKDTIQKDIQQIDSVADNDDMYVSTNESIVNQKPLITTKGRYYYWTKKFPFITSRRRYTMGLRFL